MDLEISITKNPDQRALEKNLETFLEDNCSLLPKKNRARIVLKPNLNSTMNALTGNTTDLRIIYCVIRLLQKRGYKNIVVAEGTSSGFYRNEIDVAGRLKIKALAHVLGVNFLDLNYCRGSEIIFANKRNAQIARDCLEADLFINLPKLKMHHEVGISACLKNMMGCLVGQGNKKKTHHSLARNIVYLNRYLKPHLHIVDGLIAMEGNGPSDGMPVRMDTIIAGTDPFLLDMVCAELVGIPFGEIPYLRIAEEMGSISAAHTAALKNLDLAEFKRDLLKPHVPLLLRITCNHVLQKYFQMVRHAPGLYELCNTTFMGDVFLRLGIRQEHFIREDVHIKGMMIHRDKCPPGCAKCNDYCPLGLDVPEILSNGGESPCIKCLYCYMVCPKEAIRLEGNLGFLKSQIDKYDPLIRRIA
jgi:uncharacterized protein (DUF362 family)/NAD-dependent dihydropyrimidine dehydrogenase PreA subunit